MKRFPAQQRAIQVHLMHQCPIVSAGLRAILSTQPDFLLSTDAHGAPPAGSTCVVIADYESGVNATRGEPVLVLTYQVKAEAIRHAMESGVRGYVIQGCDAGELIEAVRMLGRGGCYLSPVAGRLQAEELQRAPLTRREAEVLQVLVRGSSDKVIARGLGIGVGTVKTHMKQLFRKLGASTRTQVVIKAMDLGLHESLGELGHRLPLLDPYCQQQEKRHVPN
ncbi:DNA-binding response regulator [Duganella caerulea]|uniref:LuxR C-terminal-related transcriptional regulator n=1 Tax=Duganella caerulea TaxID=2885762 RepID=UPI0030EAD2B6